MPRQCRLFIKVVISESRKKFEKSVRRLRYMKFLASLSKNKEAWAAVTLQIHWKMFDYHQRLHDCRFLTSDFADTPIFNTIGSSEETKLQTAKAEGTQDEIKLP